MLAAGLPLAVYGRGWDTETRFRDVWQGPVQTRGQFNAAITASSGIIYPWPHRYTHAMDGLQLPVISPGRHATLFLQEVRDALAGNLPVKHDRVSNAETVPVISWELITRLLETSGV